MANAISPPPPLKSHGRELHIEVERVSDVRSFELTSRGCPRLLSPVKTRISYGAVVGFKIGVAFQLAVVGVKADEGSVG